MLTNLEEAVTAAKEAKNAQTLPVVPQEPSGAVGASEATERSTGQIPPLSDENPSTADAACVCEGGMLKGEPCPFCELGQEHCRFCRSRSYPRRLLEDGRAECLDEDACAQRDATGSPVPDQALPGAESVGVAITTAQEQGSSTQDEKHPCSLCGSSRAETVFVTDGRLGDETAGVWRCSRASDCARRAALAEARAQLGE